MAIVCAYSAGGAIDHSARAAAIAEALLALNGLSRMIDHYE
jgi:hypothetical protein